MDDERGARVSMEGGERVLEETRFECFSSVPQCSSGKSLAGQCQLADLKVSVWLADVEVAINSICGRARSHKIPCFFVGGGSAKWSGFVSNAALKQCC